MSNKVKPHEDPVVVEQASRKMLSELSEEQVEKAALSSYAYFTGKNKDREGCALAMAKRHFLADKGDYSVALDKMRNAINFFDEIDVSSMRKCFYDSDDGGPLDEMRKAIESDVSAGRLAVCGEDFSGRAIHIVLCRNKITDNPDALLRGHIYAIERCLAATESKTNGKIEKSIVAYDFSGMSRSHIIPLKTFRKIGAALQNYYPERLHCTYLIDVPVFIRSLWKVFSPFIDPVTRKKIVFINGKDEKEKTFEKVLAEENAMPFIRPGGKMSSQIDMNTFLYKTPFDCSYGVGESSQTC